MNKIAAAALMFFGAALTVLGVSALLQESRYEEAAVRLEALLRESSGASVQAPPERFKLVDGVTTSGELGMDVLRKLVPEDELPGPTLAVPLRQPGDKYVSPKGAADQGNGTADAPWSGLQFALERLAPGDRLVVLGGFYRGPFMIGGNVPDGTPENPITIYFQSDALLTGAAEGEACESAVLTVLRSHWNFQGITITPQFCDVGMRVDSRVDGMLVDSPHIFGGAGSGIVVGDNAKNIRIAEPHLHHLGNLEGKDKEMKRRGELEGDDVLRASSRAAAIRAPEAGVAVLGGKIHNHFGPMLLLVDGQGHPLDEAQARAQLVAWGVATSEGQERWW
jgi:hypothetical protein